MPHDLRAYLPSEPADFVQIVMIWVVIYLVLRFVRGTIAATLLRGAVLLVAFAVVVTAVVLRAFHLRVLESILSALGSVAVIASLVIFQPELRRGLLSLGEHRLFSRLRTRAPGALDELCGAVQVLAKSKIGALFAIEQTMLLHHIAKSGVPLDAEARRDLLVTIFWPGSPLHDGGALLRGDRVVAAACIFPLAERRELASSMGTRHRAGLGLSEESDAVIVIVSEETGRVSIARSGTLTVVDPADLREALAARLGSDGAPEPLPRLAEHASAAVGESAGPGLRAAVGDDSAPVRAEPRR